MASYLQNVTDQGIQTPLYQPDFSFLAANQQKKTEQYQQGLSEVSAGYNAILNAPVTDNGNKVAKEQYANTAQQGLRKLSAQDLSLPTNVAQAEALYAPFWQDNLLVQDIAFTKYSNNELGKLDSWKTSKDKEIRDMYSPDAELWIQQGLEDFSKADRNPEVYKRMQKRSAVPFADIEADINEAYKLEGQTGVENTNIYGNKIVTEKNGIRSKDAFRTWYLSKIGDKYDQQLYITESVRIHRAKQEILRQNPGLDEKSLNEHFANEQMDHLDRSYTGNIAAYNNEVENWNRKYSDLYTQIQNQKGKATPSDLANLELYRSNIKANHDIADQYRNEYERYGSGDRSSSSYQKTIGDIAEHPEDYLAKIQKSIMADNWATGMSKMNTETKVTLDPSWKAYTDLAIEQSKLTLEQRKIDATNRGQSYDLYKTAGVTYPGGPQDPRYRPDMGGWNTDKGIGNGSGVTGIPNPQSASYIGPTIVDPAHLNITVDKVQDIQRGNIAKITGEIYSPTGIVASLSADGLDASTIIDFSEWGRSGQAPSPTQEAAINRVKKVLQDNGIPIDNIRGPQAMEGALLQYSAIAAQKLLGSHNVAKIEQGKALITAYMGVKGTRDIAIANQREYDQALHDELTGHPNDYKKILVNENGNNRIVKPSDITSSLRSTGLQQVVAQGEDGSRITLTPEQIGDAYSRGNVDGDAATINMDGHKYSIISTNGHPDNQLYTNPHSEYSYRTNRFKDFFIDKIKDRYGTSTQINDLKRKLSSAVLPKMRVYDNGIIVQSTAYDPNIKGQENMAIGTSKEAVNPANTDISKAYIEGEKPNQSSDIVTAARNLIGSEDDLKKYTNGFQVTVTPDGTKALAYKFKNVIPKNVTIEGIDGDKFEGKTIVLPVTPGANTPYINSLPWNEGNYTYQNLLTSNKPIHSDPVVEASGWRYTIHPYQSINGKNTKCSISFERAIPNPLHPEQTTWTPIPEESKTVDMLQGPNAKTPDEIVYFSNSLLAQHLDNIVIDARTRAQNTTAGTPIQH